MVHLAKAGPDTGFFSTEEVRPSSKPTKSTSRTISLPKTSNGPYYKKPPNLAAGFRSLHLSHEAPVRANLVADKITCDDFRITLETWGNSTLYSASATWMEHKADSKDCLFGQFDTQENASPAASKAKTPTHQQEHSSHITFPRPFAEPPEIICWLNRIDMASGSDRNWRIRAYASTITPTSFTAHIDAWSDSVLHGAAMCWIAYPARKTRVASGSFSTQDVRSWSNPKPKNSAVVKFKEGVFRKPPTVLVALNMLDMAGNADLRVAVDAEQVGPEGFRWRLDTQGDSTLYAAGASWIALGFV